MKIIGAFLTKKIKKKKMENLIEVIKNNKVDKEMIPYLKRINKINGICTTNCCYGHLKEKHWRGNKNYYPGHGYVSLYLSKKNFDLLYNSKKLQKLSKYLDNAYIRNDYSFYIKYQERIYYSPLVLILQFYSNRWRKSLEKIIDLLETVGDT